MRSTIACAVLLTSTISFADEPKPLVDFMSLKIMHDKGILTDAEYASARGEIGANVGSERADENMSVVIGKWSASLYGFLEGDFIFDSTQSFSDLAGNAAVARPLQWNGAATPQPNGQPINYYAGSNPRLQFGVRNTRFGLRMRAPEFHQVRASGTLEMDFLGFDTPSTEAAVFNNPTLRVRHAYLKVETPIVDFLIGQYWHMFGWQPLYFPNTVEIQGLPGELYERTPQVRLSHRFAMGPTSLEIGGAALRPPTRDGAIPDLAGGIRFAIDKWRGVQTTGSTSTQLAPASIAVTGDYRDFRLPVFQQLPTQTIELATAAVAVDAFIPIIPASENHRGNALSISGEFVYGGGISDMYTGLTGGITMPTIVNTVGTSPALPYPGTVDNGMVVFDSCPQALGVGTSCHDLHAVVWQTTIVGLQYYFPGVNGRIWVAANYAHIESPNTKDFTSTTAPNPNISQFVQGSSSIGFSANNTAVRASEDWIDGNIFFEPHASVRIGLEYAAFIDHYVDGVTATNHRAQLSGFFLF